jgi:NAD(P)-dependent dehydrogenase (short-subunit alcohol dehydrogenase family)
VTGGGTGLGLLTATALAQNGCRVYITGRRLDVLEEAVKKIKEACKAVPGKEAEGEAKVVAVQADVSDKPGIESTSLFHLLS